MIRAIDGGTPAPRLGALIAATVDAAVQEAVARQRRADDPGVALSWVLLGSMARREPLPSSDVDTAVVWDWHVRRRTAAVEEARRSAEREQVATRMQQRLVRLASHELRTPITVARGYTEMLREDSTDARVVDDTAIVLDELSKLERITGRLLALAWAHDAQGHGPVDIEALTHRVARRWAPVVGSSLIVEVAPATVMGDEDRLETALDCLVENAITHTSADPSIVLRAYRLGPWAVLEVEDDGPGMPPGQQAAAPDGLPDAANAQRGLGLTIVRGVVDSHGGELRLGEGRSGGLRVRIRLPLAPRGPAPAEATTRAVVPTT